MLHQELPHPGRGLALVDLGDHPIEQAVGTPRKIKIARRQRPLQVLHPQGDGVLGLGKGHGAAEEVDVAAVMAGIGPLDVGQSCVVQRRQVLAIEGKFGTDWMLASLQHRPGSRSDDDVAGADDPDARGGVFYKAAKPGQDRRIDLPVVGVDTIVGAKKARLDGVVVEENGVMVLDLAAVVRAADELGLFFWVRRP